MSELHAREGEALTLVNGDVLAKVMDDRALFFFRARFSIQMGLTFTTQFVVLLYFCRDLSPMAALMIWSYGVLILSTLWCLVLGNRSIGQDWLIQAGYPIGCPLKPAEAYSPAERGLLRQFVAEGLWKNYQRKSTGFLIVAFSAFIALICGCFSKSQIYSPITVGGVSFAVTAITTFGLTLPVMSYKRRFTTALLYKLERLDEPRRDDG